MDIKICSRCNIECSYYKSEQICKKCYSKEYYKKNKNKSLLYSKNRYKNDPVFVENKRLYGKKYREKNMEKIEAKLTTKLNKWLKKNIMYSFVYEVKQVKKEKKFYYSSGSFKKQLPNLLCAKHNDVIYKLPDTGWGTPFDGFRLCRVPAYLVIFFDKDFYVIDIDDVFKEIETGSKGLVEEKANDICKYKDHL